MVPTNRAISLASASFVLVSCGTTDLSEERSCPDRDLDGYRSSSCGGEDCDDDRPDVHPGAAETCLDGVDNDCDGHTDGPALSSPVTNLSGDECTDAVDLAWTGSEYGVAWSINNWPGIDACRGREDISWQLGRVSAAGDLLAEPTRMEYPTGPELEGRAGRLSLAWTGSGYGLAWTAQYVGLDYFPSELYLTLMDSFGRPSGDASLVRGAEADPCSVPLLLAWTGSSFSLVWMHGCASSYGNLYHVKLVPGGPVPTEDSLFAQEVFVRISLVWTGSELAVAWLGESVDGATLAMYLARLTASGELLGLTSPQRDWSRSVTGLALAWTGSELGLAWSQGRPGDERRDVRYARLGPAGDPIEEEAVLLDEAGEAAGFYIHDFLWTGRVFVLIGTNGPFGLRFVGFDSSGSGVEISAVSGLAANGPNLSTVSTGSEIGLAWTDVSGAHLARIGMCE